MAKPLIVRLNKGRLPPEVGKKAGNLRRLADKGFRVPQSWVCTWEAYERYLQDDPGLIAELSSQLARIISGQQAYAVRSSANLEDDLNHSYAGQFKSQLNVRGPEQVLQAIWSIWSSVNSATVQSYQQSRSLAPEGVRMAVLIQEMVEPQLSGVAFSKNPMTGMDEVLVEAVRGPGTLLVQEGIDPLRWVNKWGTWLQQAQDSGIDPQIIQSIVEQTREISQEMDSDVDLEWVYDGSQVYWVQVRDITTISNLNIYSNRISREMLPGQVKPLIWSINTRLVNQAWVKLIEEAVGTTGIDPDSLSKAFYYRAYFNMGTFGKVFSSLGLPRESLEIMMGIVPAEVRKPRFRPPVKLILKSGRLVRFMADKLRFSRLIDRFLPQCSQVLETISHTGLDDLSPSQLFAQIDRIYAITSQVAYYNIVGPLLNSFYHSLLMRQLKRQGVDYKKLDLISDLAELKQYDPNHHLADLHASYLQLSEPERTRLTGEGPASQPESPRLSRFASRWRHSSPSLAISVTAATIFHRCPGGSSPRSSWGSSPSTNPPGKQARTGSSSNSWSWAVCAAGCCKRSTGAPGNTASTGNRSAPSTLTAMDCSGPTTWRSPTGWWSKNPWPAGRRSFSCMPPKYAPCWKTPRWRKTMPSGLQTA